VKLYKTCEKLKSELDQNCGLAQMVKNMKKVTCAFFGFIGSLFKLALLLNKANFIALKQISPDLPKVLKKTGALLTLGTASMCLIENSWAITSFFNKSRSSSQPDLQALFGSSKFKKLGIRFASEVFNTGVAILDVASLFCGWYLSPIVLVSLSTVSFINSLASKIFQDHEINFLYKQNFEEVSMDVQLPV
jgi:hypothetical protein